MTKHIWLVSSCSPNSTVLHLDIYLLFSVGFHHFFVIFVLPRQPYAIKNPILQKKDQPNSFIFEAGALFQKFLTI